MRQGFRVIDSDTHVNPSLDVLLRYADKQLREHLDELAPYRKRVKPGAGRGDAEDLETTDILTIRPVRLQRVAGEKPRPATEVTGDRGFLSGRTQMVTRHPITPRVAEDNSRGRLADMDREGRDIDFIIPGPWCYGAPALAPHLAQGLYRAYHRYMAEYCAADMRRLKSMVLALGTDPTWAAEVVKTHAHEDWVAAVWPLLPEGMPIDDPDLEPIWAAADEADLPIMYHAFTIETPYFPGYRDVWDNPAMGRCAGQTWGGQRFLSFMLMGGMLDRYPRLRVAALEAGHAWLPHWLVRLTRQIDYVRGSVSPTIAHTPVEYAQQGRVFLSIDLSEGPALTKAAIDVLGDHAFMFASDYPHPETIFPDHADAVIAWREALGEAAMRKLMWENAARFFRLASTPW
ncbi:MAG TPA: amidohydrolase family protein [Candidatus Methylomirabilis sp.]|nr:amidohydrolase family protein [Candidatus Methylomirabilis sp.]